MINGAGPLVEQWPAWLFGDLVLQRSENGRSEQHQKGNRDQAKDEIEQRKDGVEDRAQDQRMGR